VSGNPLHITNQAAIRASEWMHYRQPRPQLVTPGPIISPPSAVTVSRLSGTATGVSAVSPAIGVTAMATAERRAWWRQLEGRPALRWTLFTVSSACLLYGARPLTPAHLAAAVPVEVGLVAALFDLSGKD
jgi:hypothetical protein